MAGVRSSVGAASLTAALVVGLLVGCVAHAQEAEKRERSLGQAAAEQEQYVGKLVVFDAKQIALGELALQRSKDPQVRRFARQLVADHRKHLGDLRAWADGKRMQIAAVDLSTAAPEAGTGGSGNAGIQEGYEERMVGVDKHLDEVIGDAQKDLNEVREKQGKDFDKVFISRVVDDQEKGQKLVSDGLDKYRADAAFGLLLNRTGNLVDRHVERGKQVEKVVD